MPFTISHPAVVLPLKQLWPQRFSLTGLIAGAMAPDLLYFLLCDTADRGISHSWTGLLWFCLPAGIVFSFVFHWLFKKPVIDHLPWFLERRFSGLAESEFVVKSASGWITLIGSVLLGALSHFLWDSFTHLTGEMARALPVLTESVTIFGHTRPVCRWIQHLSSLWGGTMMLFFLFRSRLVPRPVRSRPVRPPGRKVAFWLGATVAAIVCGIAAVALYDNLYGWNVLLGHNPRLAFTSFCLGSWAGGFYFACSYHVLMRKLRPRR
jgi:hypothetical protein